MRIQLHYTVEVRDKEGKCLKRIRRRSRSFVRAWNEIINVFASVTNRDITDTGNTVRSVNAGTWTLEMEAGAGVTNYGVRVGTGTTAVTISDYTLETPIAEGTGSGQMEHLASRVSAPSVVGSDCSFTVTRTAVNSGGATIAATEIGIYVQHANTWNFLVVRDVLASPVDVPDGGAITVVYTIKVTV